MRRGFVTDGEMALLHAYGRVKEFEVFGNHNTTITWTEGERLNTSELDCISNDSTRRNDGMRRQR
ncbi:hypothetical protein RBH29_15610 [Herbivorax sp. ANBcel31]|uniref:hypothetical protein n=1 Tax=Herbivorax sp. ANBcel31 TaxID=3069754 RepID=UPI0027B41B0E|nr:hypothetical protein [Herbivorax sp. ANBcel31]MDQ2087858.1 hypothetical protein [Herbivorax sp. ANBcel31]